MAKYNNYYLKRILENLDNGGSTYFAVKSIVVDNLKAKGVDCSMNDGMTTLANKILEIQGGTIELDYDVSLSLTGEDCYVGETITLTASLNVSIDNTTVDLFGGLDGATVKFYLGDTLLGTSTTNDNGVATYDYTPSSADDYTFNAVFDGADDFDDATSNDVTVSVTQQPTYQNITITCLDATTSEPLYKSETYNTKFRLKYEDSSGNVNYLESTPDGRIVIFSLKSGTYSISLFEVDNEYNRIYWKSDGSTSIPIIVDSEHTSFTIYWSK